MKRYWCVPQLWLWEMVVGSRSTIGVWRGRDKLVGTSRDRRGRGRLVVIVWVEEGRASSYLG